MIKNMYFNLGVDAANISIGAVKQNDLNSIKFVIGITDNGDPADLTDVTYATMTIKRPDDTYNNGYCVLEGDNKISYILPINTVNQIGIHEGEIHLYSVDDVVKVTAGFYYDVKESLFVDEGVTDQDNYPILVQLIDDVSTLETDIETAEAIRVSSENTRVSNENTRLTSEATRVSNEAIRQTNESDRETYETNRISAEGDRSIAESIRVTYEDNRVSAENARISSETTRQSNESVRVSSETSRQSEEDTRVSNETSRIAAETARSSAETERENSETTRISNEAQRVINDADRLLKSVYDTDDNGVVDNSEHLGGELPSHYATVAQIEDIESATVTLDPENQIKSFTDSKLDANVTSLTVPGMTLYNNIVNGESFQTTAYTTDIINKFTNISFKSGETWYFNAGYELIEGIENTISGEIRIAAPSTVVLVSALNYPNGRIVTFASDITATAIYAYGPVADSGSDTIANWTNLFAIKISDTPQSTWSAEKLAASIGGYFEGFGHPNAITVDSAGKNLLNPNDFELGTKFGTFFPKATFFQNDVISIVASGLANNIVTYPLEFKAGDTIYYKYTSRSSSSIYPRVIKKSNDTLLVKLSTLGSVGSYTTAFDCYIDLNFDGTPSAGTIGTISELIISDYQFTEYEPFVGTSQTVKFAAPEKYAHAHVPNGVSDEFRLDGITQRVSGKITFDGSESWTSILPLTNTLEFYIPNFITANGYYSAADNINRFCSDYPMKVIYNVDEEGMFVSATHVFIRILRSKLLTEDVAGFKTWLASNNVHSMYQLAQPITYTVEDFQSIGVTVTGDKPMTHAGYTQISATMDLFSSMEVKYSSNVASVISNNSNAINAIDKKLITPDEDIVIDNGFIAGWSGEVKIRVTAKGEISYKVDLEKSTDNIGSETVYTIDSFLAPVQSVSEFTSLLNASGVPVSGAFANVSIDASGNLKVDSTPSSAVTGAYKISCTLTGYLR